MSISVGINIRNMGVQSTPDLMRHCALEAERAALHSIWVTDHIAIPPDDAEGSGGRYLDPLASLAWLAGQTERILLGTALLVLPYRPKLPTAKWIATVQELSGGRLLLGAGIGWMKAEFQATGVPIKNRASVSDDILAFLEECFTDDIVTANGQDFLFRPRPAKPPILIGGAAPHAIDRALRFGDGWMPMSNEPEKLAPEIKAYKDAAKATGKPASVYTFLKISDDLSETADRLKRLEDAGVDVAMASVAYDDADGFSRGVDAVQKIISA